ncbi:hypothetical protein FOB83_29490 (plasmid) [Cupriavidus metallidurans]|nr:hypothetical protein FOB83_29490 [Cupriavidus metallidurans]
MEMLVHRRWESLDAADHGWLRAKHHFQVDAAGNPAHHPLGSLIVWNDDEIAVGAGFPLHGHRDMEIVTYVRQGTLEHRDTLGSIGTIRAGEVQVMSAGRGIRHAESNRGSEPLRLYQIWLLPRERGGDPRWETRPFPEAGRFGRFAVLASGFPGDGDALPIRANARLLAATLGPGDRLTHSFAPHNNAYLVVASGRIAVDGEFVGLRDGVAITNAASIDVAALEHSELVMVETR